MDIYNKLLQLRYVSALELITNNYTGNLLLYESDIMVIRNSSDIVFSMIKISNNNNNNNTVLLL
jgi:hypothetical protein